MCQSALINEARAAPLLPCFYLSADMWRHHVPLRGRVYLEPSLLASMNNVRTNTENYLDSLWYKFYWATDQVQVCLKCNTVKINVLSKNTAACSYFIVSKQTISYEFVHPCPRMYTVRLKTKIILLDMVNFNYSIK